MNASTDKSKNQKKNTERKSGGADRYRAVLILNMIYVNGICIRIFIYRGLHRGRRERGFWRFL